MILYNIMNIPQDLSPELLDEYNRCYEKGVKLLSKYVIIQGSRRRRIGLSDRNRIKEAIFNLSRCVEIQPNAWNAMWGLGKAYQALDSHDVSLRWFGEL